MCTDIELMFSLYNSFSMFSLFHHFFWSDILDRSLREGILGCTGQCKHNILRLVVTAQFTFRIALGNALSDSGCHFS